MNHEVGSKSDSVEVDQSVTGHLLVCVYRRRNEQVVHDLVTRSGCLSQGCEVRLWALDSMSDLLEPFTVGVGKGSKFELCNRLIAESEANFIVVADDDVLVHDLHGVVEVMSATGLDLAQPSHDWRSNSTYRFCRRRPWLLARETNFVEIGPIFIVGPQARSRILPFPDGIGMGWGLEFDWFERLQPAGLSMGIVDAHTMRHLGKLGADYDMAVEGKRLRTYLDRHGVASVEDFQQSIRHIRIGSRRR